MHSHDESSLLWSCCVENKTKHRKTNLIDLNAVIHTLGISTNVLGTVGPVQFGHNGLGHVVETNVSVPLESVLVDLNHTNTVRKPREWTKKSIHTIQDKYHHRSQIYDHKWDGCLCMKNRGEHCTVVLTIVEITMIVTHKEGTDILTTQSTTREGLYRSKKRLMIPVFIEEQREVWCFSPNTL